jgi:hypothetical protein
VDELEDKIEDIDDVPDAEEAKTEFKIDEDFQNSVSNN